MKKRGFNRHKSQRRSLDSQIREVRKLLKFYRRLSKTYLNCAYYKRIIFKLEQEEADLVSKIGSKK